MKNLFLSIFAASVVASCTTAAVSKVGKSQESLVDSQWVLGDHVKGKTPTLVVENGKVSGNAGCNNYFGELSLDPTAGNFVAQKIGSTRMACDNMSVEGNYLSMLQEANKYVVKGNTLELYKNNLLLLKFNRK